MKVFTKLNLLIILIASFTCEEAQARFNVEPYIKKYWGGFEKGEETGNISGESSGLNAGYIGKYFLAGMTFELGNFKYSPTVTDKGHTLFKGGGVGTYLGFHFYDRLKIWTGYLNSSIEPKHDDSFRYFGQQMSFGLGIRIWEYVILNYELYSNYFTQVEDYKTGKTQSLEKNIKSQKQTLGLSAFFIF